MNPEVENCIKSNYLWARVPTTVKQSLGNSTKEYDKAILQYFLRNQLKYKGLIKQIRPNPENYYEELIQFSRQQLILFPYHLSEFIINGLGITPFKYYRDMIIDLLSQEKSYDSLPNFTAIDGQQLLGIGRNQYIELMNNCRSSKRLWSIRKKDPGEFLPSCPVDSVNFETWWEVRAGCIMQEDVKRCTDIEKQVIDSIADNPRKGVLVGEEDYNIVRSLYKKGLIYLTIPVQDDDHIQIPPLEGFIMNRIQNDYIEQLLYKIFVSITENTSVKEIADMLGIDLALVKDAVSIYIRLGLAKKKNVVIDFDRLHPSWRQIIGTRTPQDIARTPTADQAPKDWMDELKELEEGRPDTDEEDPVFCYPTTSDPVMKRLGILYDSKLTALLMMGSISEDLKKHAVTMFEVGKLADESLDSFLKELDKVTSMMEGETAKYFQHARILRQTLLFLRGNVSMAADLGLSFLGVDLVACESLMKLEKTACARVLERNYSMLLSLAPLGYDVQSVTSCQPPHVGPPVPEVNSIWFKLFIYTLTKSGPPSLLLRKGARLRHLPKLFWDFDELLVTTWTQEPQRLCLSAALAQINELLLDSPMLVQGYISRGHGSRLLSLSFPFAADSKLHPAVAELSQHVDLRHSCGFVTLVNTHAKPVDDLDQDVPPLFDRSISSICTMESIFEENNGVLSRSDSVVSHGELDEADYASWVLLDCHFGLPIFDEQLNTEVCKKLVDLHLFSKESFEQLLQSNRALCLRFLDFIDENQGSHNLFEEALVPLPSGNLLFDGNQLSSWIDH